MINLDLCVDVRIQPFNKQKIEIKDSNSHEYTIKRFKKYGCFITQLLTFNV